MVNSSFVVRLFLSIILCRLSLALPNDLKDADSYAITVPKRHWSDFSGLAQFLKQSSASGSGKSELFRARVIYRWVVGHIKYKDLDTDSFPVRPAWQSPHGSYFNDGLSPQQTLVRRFTDCEGFALLYEALSREMGLQVMFISGFAGLNGVTGYHAWNAVQIDGQWEMVDVTWGAHPEQRERWFLTPKSKFLTSHVPDKEFLNTDCYSKLRLSPATLGSLKMQLHRQR